MTTGTIGTPLATDPAERRASLGWRMQLIRAEMWATASTGDAWARLLLHADDDDAAAVRTLVEAGPVSRSVTGATVVVDPGLGHTLLSGPDLGCRAPGGGTSPLQVLDLATLGLGVDDPEGASWPRPPVDVVASAVEAGLSAAVGAGAGPVDLVPVARTAAVALAAAVSGADAQQVEALWPQLAPALDAQLTPQRLDDAWGVLRGGARLRVVLRELGIDPTGQRRRVAELAVLGAVLERAMLGVVLRAAAQEPCWARLRDGTAADAREIAELGVRHDPPVRCHARVARRDLVLAGHPVAAGEQVVVLDVGTAPTSLSAADPLLAGVLDLVVDGAAAFGRALARHGRPEPVTALRARRSPSVRRYVSVLVMLREDASCVSC